MTLAAADLLVPLGEIDGELFYPKLDSAAVTARVTAYLTAGYAKATAAGVTDTADADELARVFSYWRAWSDVVNVLTLSPASASIGGDVSTSFLQTQINQWIVGRDAWKAALDTLVPSSTPSTTAAPSYSGAVPTQIRF